jgi:hypothetical protein
MDAQSMTVLKTIKEEHMISLKKDIAEAADAVATQRGISRYVCCLSFFEDCHQSR